jgi:nucleoid-associated protein YgaU
MATDLERYGVFALIFVVLLIVGISIWGPQREQESLLASAAGAVTDPVATTSEALEEGRAVEPIADPLNDARIEHLTAFYKVRNDDNPTKIARKLWGHDRYVNALLEANPGVRPNALRVDDLLRLPAVEERPDARYAIPASDLAMLAVASSQGSGTATPEPRHDATSGSGGASKTEGKDVTKKPAPPGPGSRYHVVRKGERLEKIAKRYYGSANHVAKIQAANPGLENPDRIRAGMKLILP